jgi:hypothetical protein
MANGWLGRRKSPRLSGTLHILDPGGRELAVPLRGRATVLTAGGTGLTGYGEVWAVHTTADTAETNLMISYGRDGSPELRESGLCTAGGTVVLGGVTFTWRRQTAAIPNPRTANMPRPVSTPQKANAHPEPAIASRLSNMLRNRPSSRPPVTRPHSNGS